MALPCSQINWSSPSSRTSQETSSSYSYSRCVDFNFILVVIRFFNLFLTGWIFAITRNEYHHKGQALFGRHRSCSKSSNRLIASSDRSKGKEECKTQPSCPIRYAVWVCGCLDLATCRVCKQHLNVSLPTKIDMCNLVDIRGWAICSCSIWKETK